MKRVCKVAFMLLLVTVTVFTFSLNAFALYAGGQVTYDQSAQKFIFAPDDPAPVATGDTTHIALWVLLATVSAVLMVLLIILGKRKNPLNNNKASGARHMRGTALCCRRHSVFAVIPFSGPSPVAPAINCPCQTAKCVV